MMNEVKTDNVSESEREEGEISEGCDDNFENISSEEEFEFTRERIAELEARNLELEKIASISCKSYDYGSDGGCSDIAKGSIVAPPPPHWHTSKREKGSRRAHSQKDRYLESRKKKSRVFEKYRRISSSSRPKTVKRSRRRKSKKPIPKRISSSEDSDEPYSRKELEAALCREQYKNKSPPSSLKAALLYSPRNLVLHISDKEISPDVEIIDSPKTPIVHVDLTKDEDLRKRHFEEAYLEEQELRLAALKSAYLKKSKERKRKKLMQIERPYSPTDNIEKIDCPCPPTPVTRDETDYSDNNMDISISPIYSPSSNIDDDQLVDMELAMSGNSNSPVSYVEAIFANDPLLMPCNAIENKSKIEPANAVSKIDDINTNKTITNGDVVMKELLPEIACKNSVVNNNKESEQIKSIQNSTDESPTDISLEADCLRSLLLQNLKKKAKPINDVAKQDKKTESVSPTTVLKSITPLNTMLPPSNPPPQAVAPLTTLPLNTTNTASAIQISKLKSKTIPLAVVGKKQICDNKNNLNKNSTIIKKHPIPKILVTKPNSSTAAASKMSLLTKGAASSITTAKPSVVTTTVPKLKKSTVAPIKKLLTARKIENVITPPNKMLMKSLETTKISPITPPVITPPTSRISSLPFESKAVPKLVIRLGNSDSSDSDDFNMPSAINEKENKPNTPKTTTATVTAPPPNVSNTNGSSSSSNNNNFEAKLDAFLKIARSRVEQHSASEKTPSKVNVLMQNGRTTTAVAVTPVAVRHLPPSSQLEYKQLVHRMKILEQQKVERLTTKITQTAENISVTVRNDLITNESENNQETAKETEAIMNLKILEPIPEKKVTMPIDTLTVKIEMSNNAKRSVTTVKPKLAPIVKRRLSGQKAKEVGPKVQTTDNKEQSIKYQKMLETLKDKNDDEKLEALKAFEMEYSSSSELFIGELNALINLIKVAQREKQQQIIYETEVQELRQKLIDHETKLAEQKKVCSQMYPKISVSHKSLLVSRNKCTNIDKFCKRVGAVVKGSKYKIPNDKIDVIINKLKTISAESKKLKDLNAASPIIKSTVARTVTDVQVTASPIIKSAVARMVTDVQVTASPIIKSAVARTVTDVQVTASPIIKSAVTRTVNEVPVTKIVDDTSANNIIKGEVEDEPMPQEMNVVEDAIMMKDDESINSLRQYQSPLEYMKTAVDSSSDPNAVICPFELGGKCEDSTCQYKHFIEENQQAPIAVITEPQQQKHLLSAIPIEQSAVSQSTAK